MPTLEWIGKDMYYFTSKGKGGIRFKNHIKVDAGKLATNLWTYSEVGHTDEAKKELKAIFNGIAPIETPKPSRLIERILQIATDMPLSRSASMSAALWQI